MQLRRALQRQWHQAAADGCPCVATCSYYICERLEGPFWVWVATLAAAIYAGYPSQCDASHSSTA